MSVQPKEEEVTEKHAVEALLLETERLCKQPVYAELIKTTECFACLYFSNGIRVGRVSYEDFEEDLDVDKFSYRYIVKRAPSAFNREDRKKLVLLLFRRVWIFIKKNSKALPSLYAIVKEVEDAGLVDRGCTSYRFALQSKSPNFRNDSNTRVMAKYDPWDVDQFLFVSSLVDDTLYDLIRTHTIVNKKGSFYPIKMRSFYDTDLI